MKTERLQVLVEAEQRARLERAATQRGVSVASLVRSAIDVAYPPAAEGRAAAARELLQATPMEVPEPAGLRAELEQLRGDARIAGER